VYSWQAQSRVSPKAERNPHNKTKDMSFIIKSHASSAFAASGLQERHAHDRRPANRSNLAARPQGSLTDSCEMTQAGKAAAAIREARDFQSRLNESLSFLQTQDSALGQIESLFANSPEGQDFLEVFESLAAEKFNGLDLFTQSGDEQPLFVQTPESTATVCIHRPLLTAESPTASLSETVRAARVENHIEQAMLRDISISSADIHSLTDMGAEKISTPQSAKESIARSQKYVLSDSAVALSSQANSAHEAVLRLFS
jgi:hypothetical protein